MHELWAKYGLVISYKWVCLKIAYQSKGYIIIILPMKTAIIGWYVLVYPHFITHLKFIYTYYIILDVYGWLHISIIYIYIYKYFIYICIIYMCVLYIYICIIYVYMYIMCVCMYIPMTVRSNHPIPGFSGPQVPGRSWESQGQRCQQRSCRRPGLRVRAAPHPNQTTHIVCYK